MTLQDIPLGMRLKANAQWNQLESDWELLVRAGGHGNFVALYQGIAAGTATTLAYQNRFSWIGMVLVDPAFRGLGIGTALLKKTIEYAKDLGTVRLDATPQGKLLYETLGFQTERELLRMERQVAGMPELHFQPCAPITSQILPEIIKFDASVFGADRQRVLHHLFHHAPNYAFYTKRENSITGYCMGRHGSNFEQIGPIVAKNHHDAKALLLTALANAASLPAIVDIFSGQAPWLATLQAMGFRTQRPFTRMFLGSLKHPGQPDLQYAIAGPELG